MSFLSKIRGTIETIFQIGSDGAVYVDRNGGDMRFRDVTNSTPTSLSEVRHIARTITAPLTVPSGFTHVHRDMVIPAGSGVTVENNGELLLL